MKKEELIKSLIELWDEYSLSKNWWHKEDVTFMAFIKWLKNGCPGNPTQSKK